jgi:predicted extracellular nuclease
MKKVLLYVVLLFTALITNAQDAEDLFFSEYVEGSSNNKYLEIFNGTGATVNLSDYQVLLFTNGRTENDPTTTLDLGDIDLLDGNVYTIGNSSGTIFSPDLTSGVANFNGDDALAIKKKSNGAYVDIFGCIGEDPGSAWTDGSHSTANKTLVRKKWVTVGVKANPPTGFPTLTSEWDVYDQDVNTYLGNHTFDPTITGSLTLTYPVGGEDFQTDETVNFTWTATDVTTIKFQVWISELGAWEDMEGLTAVDASLGTLPFTIPIDAEEGDYKIRIMDVDQAPLTSESDFFHITDVHFAGLDTYPFNPENGATDVPIDLFTGYLQMYFNERVQVGTGNIYLKRFDDDAVIETFNVTDASKVMIDTEWGGDVYVKISSNLSTSTQYYVEVDAGAITDRATTPNAFEGFTGKTTWAFTTGLFDSFTSIYDIQYTTDPSGDSPYKNQVIKTKGIVMFADNDGFYIQEAAEAWKGIYISNANSAVAVGDDVTVIGTIVENFNYTQMGSIIMITVNGLSLIHI